MLNHEIHNLGPLDTIYRFLEIKSFTLPYYFCSMHYTEDARTNSGCTGVCQNMNNTLKTALYGWKLYFTHPVCLAGLGLSSFYMTVLGFDNITYGFCLSQCVSESLLGALVGVSAVVGIGGSLTYPVLRNKLGLNKTGIVGFISVIAALTLCVVSIWLDGSPFDPFYFRVGAMEEPTVRSTIMPNTTGQLTTLFSSWDGEATAINQDAGCYISSMLSVSVLLSGIIFARFGLWISDLTITQNLQVIYYQD